MVSGASLLRKAVGVSKKSAELVSTRTVDIRRESTARHKLRTVRRVSPRKEQRDVLSFHERNVAVAARR